MKFTILILSVLIFTRCSNSSSSTIEKEGIKIGTQTWMTTDLDTDTFRNGDPIIQAQTAEEWEKYGDSKQAAWCYQKKTIANGEKLYNWYAVNDPRGIAPKGWHVPSESEWDELIAQLGGTEVAGKKMKNEKNSGSNESELSFNLSGFRESDGLFVGTTLPIGIWWSSTELEDIFARGYTLYPSDKTGRYSQFKLNGHSIRLIKD